MKPHCCRAGVMQMRMVQVHNRAMDMAASHGMDVDRLEVPYLQACWRPCPVVAIAFANALESTRAITMQA